MNKILTISAIMLAAAGLLAGIVSTATARTQQLYMDLPLNPLFNVNYCVGPSEILDGIVSLHLAVHDERDKNGFTHYWVHMNVPGGTVTGRVTGTTYNVQTQVNNRVFNFVVPENLFPLLSDPFSELIGGPSIYPAIKHAEVTINVVGPGPMNNFKIHFNWVLILNANGEITVDTEANPPSFTCPDSHW